MAAEIRGVRHPNLIMAREFVMPAKRFAAKLVRLEREPSKTWLINLVPWRGHAVTHAYEKT
jgi:hypothetical protein